MPMVEARLQASVYKGQVESVLDTCVPRCGRCVALRTQGHYKNISRVEINWDNMSWVLRLVVDHDYAARG